MGEQGPSEFCLGRILDCMPEWWIRLCAIAMCGSMCGSVCVGMGVGMGEGVGAGVYEYEYEYKLCPQL